MTHAERVRVIAECFNAVLAANFGLGPLELRADNRNVYEMATELTLEGRGGTLAISVPDVLLEGERNVLDCCLGEAIARNLEVLR